MPRLALIPPREFERIAAGGLDPDARLELLVPEARDLFELELETHLRSVRRDEPHPLVGVDHVDPQPRLRP